MRALTNLPAIIAFACIISSCKKDAKIPSANEGTVITVHKSITLAEKINQRAYVRNEADRLLSFRDSTSFAYNSSQFDYDADGRISRINIYDGNGEHEHYYDLEYNSDGKVMRRWSYSIIDPQPPRYNTFTYDASGKLLVDSLFVPATTGYIPAAMTKLYYTGDNVTEAEFYSSPNTTSGFVRHSKIKYEYDNGLNPFKQIPNFYCITTFGGGNYFSRFLSKNNVVRQYQSSGTSPYTLAVSYGYKYNSSNYPWKQSPGFDPFAGDTKEIEFFYQ